MAIEYERFQRSQVAARYVESIRSVDQLAARLRAALELESAAVDAAHIHGASSASVQRIVSSILKGHLGFDEEVVLTPETGIVSRPRPDFFYRLGPDEGVIAEVERGGTVTNNHDLKDMWKVHIAPGDPRREIDVLSCHVFGYGRLA